MEFYNESLLGGNTKIMAGRAKTLLKQYVNSGGKHYDVKEDLVDKKNDRYIVSLRLNMDRVREEAARGGNVKLISLNRVKPQLADFSAYCHSNSVRVNCSISYNTLSGNEDALTMLKIEVSRRKNLKESTNIDEDLVNLLEDVIYQEGIFKKFKDKGREKILRQRRELRAKLIGLPDQMNDAIEQARHCLKEEYSFEGVHEIMVDALFLAKGALSVSNLLEPAEIEGAKKMISMYEPTRKKIMQMVAQRSKQPEDFPGRCEESMDIMEASSIQAVDRDYGIKTEANMAAWTIKNVINPYNKLMAEKQHPTDN